MKCRLDFCDKPSYCKQLCSGHYTQYRRGNGFKPIKDVQTGKPCSFEGCKNTIIAKQLCPAHRRQQRLNKELKTLSNQLSFYDRAVQHIEYNDSGCWIWTGRKTGRKRNYGQISYGGVPTFVHRALFEELVRPLESTETLDHLCRTTLCVNPEHLEVVTLRENVQRMHAYKRLINENGKLKDFIMSLGYDIDSIVR